MSNKGTKKALDMLGRLPRLSMMNIYKLPGAKPKWMRRPYEWRHKPQTGLKHHNKAPPAGWAGSGKFPVYLKHPVQNYALKFEPSYVPVSLAKLQLLVDTGRLDPSAPVDGTALRKTGHFRVDPRHEHCGFMLEEEGADVFCTPLNVEVQWASEAAIAGVERAGGSLTTAYYDLYSFAWLLRPRDFISKGLAIPPRQLPPHKKVLYYSEARNRGYLADPEEIANERLVLSQKYGYELPDLSSVPNRDVLLMRKDPRQIFFGLEPGWIADLNRKAVLKPKEELPYEATKAQAATE